MAIANIYNLFMGQEHVQVNDHAQRNKSEWTWGELMKVMPQLPIMIISCNKKGIVIYTEREVAAQLSSRRATA